MANLVEQQEAKYREQRDREREEQRREERLEQQREQARQDEREREREEQARQDALDRAGAYELESEQRRQRRQRSLDRVRAERRARATKLQREQGRFEAARQAGVVARHAVASAQQATQRAAQQRAETRQEDQREVERQSRGDLARKERRDAERRDDRRRESGREKATEERRAAARQEAREEAREQAKESARLDARQQARREDSAQQARQERRDDERRDDRRRESGQEKATEERRAAARQEAREEAREQAKESARQDSRQQARREDSAQETRDAARVRARAGERGATRREEAARGRSQQRVLEQRQAQRAQDRVAELGRAAAEQHRRDRAAVTGAAPISAVRVHGPLLLDERDQPVRLRGVLLTGLESPQRDRDGSVWPAATERELDEIARWGATLVLVPLSLDVLFEVPALVDDDPIQLPAGAELVPPDSGPSPEAAVPDPSVLEALDATIEAAAERGIFTLVQLGRLRAEGDERQLGFAWLRQFWRVIGARYESSPTVLFDLLRGPAGAGLNGTMRRPDSDVARWQRQSITLALLGELRSVHPGAVAVVESPEGVVPTLPMSLTDGSVAPNVIAGVRLGGTLDGGGLAAVAALARRVPVVVVEWGVEFGMPSQDVVGRRLASVGAHWVAGAWPPAGSWPDTGRVVPTEAGRAVKRALAAADRPAMAPQDQE